MALKKIYRKKRPQKKRYSRSSRTTTIQRGVGPIASRTITKLKYNCSFQSSGAVLDYVVNLNSLYDPEDNVLGHQPYGFDQYSTIYNRYRVFATSYILSVTSFDSNQNIVIVCPNNTSTTFTNPTLMAESPRAVTKQVNGNGTPTYFRGKYSMARLNGQTSTQYKADDRFQALTSSNPSERICLHIGQQAAVGGNTNSCMYNLTMIFHCEFFDPNQMTQS